MSNTTLVGNFGSILEYCWNGVGGTAKGWWGAIQEDVSSLTNLELEPMARQVHDLAMNILCYTVTTLVFFSHSGIFVFGFVVGAVNAEFMKGVLDDINEIWQYLLGEKEQDGEPAQLALLTVAAVIAFPGTMMIAPFFVGGYYGMHLRIAAKKKVVDSAPIDLHRINEPFLLYDPLQLLGGNRVN